MKKVMILTLCVLFLGVCSTTGALAGSGGGESAHQSPDSPGKRLAELRDAIDVTAARDANPPQNPKITIYNTTNQSIDLLVNGTVQHNLSIEPNSIRTISFMPGTYRYEAQISGLPPLAGTGTFVMNTDYSWTFSYTRP